VISLRRYNILFLSLISLFVFLSYLNSFNGELVFDDTIFADNRIIKDFGYFKSLGLNGYLQDAINGSRPVVSYTFAVNYLIGGLEPFGYHLFNALIHLANSFLVYALIYKTLRLPASTYREDAHWIAFLGTIFFSLHPIQTGAVSYVSQRAEILASFFYLLGLLFFIKALLDISLRRHMFYAAGIICFLLGLGSKEIIITLPFTLSVYWFYFLRGLPDKKNQAVRIGFLVFPVLFAIVYRINSLKDNTRVGFGLDFSPYEYLLTQFRVITKYIRLLILPVHQNFDYDIAISKGFFNPPSTFLSFMFLFVLIAAAVFLYRKWKIGSFAILWFFIILLPTSSIIPIIDVIFEHRVYLASLGFFLLFSLGLYHAFKLMNVPQKIKSYGVIFTAVVLILSLTYSTTKRNMVWISRISFWEDVVRKSPLKARGYINLGSAYEEEGLTDFAAAAYSIATSLSNNIGKPNSMLALALLYARTGKTKEALSEMESAMKLSPIDSPELRYVIGMVYAKTGNNELAIKNYKEALNKDPLFMLARYALVDLYKDKGLHDEAIREYKEIIRIGPRSAEMYNEVGVIYGKKGMFDQAKENFLLALRLDPNYTPSIKNMKTLSDMKK